MTKMLPRPLAKKVTTYSMAVQTDDIPPAPAPQPESQCAGKKRKKVSSPESKQAQAETLSDWCSSDDDMEVLTAAKFKKERKPTIAHSAMVDFLKQLVTIVKNCGNKLNASTVTGVQDAFTCTLGFEITDLPTGSRTRHARVKTAART